MSVTTLQRLVFPTPELCSDEWLYLRCSPGAWYSQATGEVRLPRGQSVRFDTYFNGFSLGKWYRHTSVRQIVLRVCAQGSVEISALVHHLYRGQRVLVARRFDADEATTFELPALNLAEVADGILGIEVRAVGDEAVVFGGSVETTDRPQRNPRLGVAITTFNRPAYVRGNLHRMAAALKKNKEYRDRIEILVVDNARNLDFEVPDGAPITVVGNRNLGGSGGFARGLMHYRERAEVSADPVSHVLFMDDDIRFDPETVLRTLDFLSYALDPNLCVAGAMLTEERPYIQFEAGATFRTEAIHPFRAIGSHVNLHPIEKLLANEVERQIGYGAWWYFAFPLPIAPNPLPVFVRGDDVSSGLSDTGAHTITLNGVGVWHQHFAYKNGPAAYYYESRNLPLVSSVNSDRYGSQHLARRFVYQTFRSLLAMKYDSAEARIAGTRSFLEGPEKWMAIDHEKLNGQIREHEGERLIALPPRDVAVPFFKPRSQITTKGGGAISAALLSGHLLPRRFSRRAPVGVEVAGWSPASVFGREQVVYRYEPTGEGFVCQRDRKRFFALSWQMLRTAAEIPRVFPDVKARYRAAYSAMTSNEYWRRQFDPDSEPTP